MCPPPCGHRRAGLCRPKKELIFPNSWMNEKRMLVGDAVLSIDGKNLVKVNPELKGAFEVPSSVKRILVGAFVGCRMDKIIVPPTLKDNLPHIPYHTNVEVK